jgi:hypothetical protein
VGAAPEEPRAVAQSAIKAFQDGDAPTLGKVAHPELKRRLRTARLLKFYLEMKKIDTGFLSTAPESKVVELFCEAHRAIVPPRDSRLDYFDYYMSTVVHGDFAIVTFDSGWKTRAEHPVENHLQNEVILEKDGGDWKFLWSPGVSLHVDLEWDPRDDLPK